MTTATLSFAILLHFSSVYTAFLKYLPEPLQYTSAVSVYSEVVPDAWLAASHQSWHSCGKRPVRLLERHCVYCSNQRYILGDTVLYKDIYIKQRYHSQTICSLLIWFTLDTLEHGNHGCFSHICHQMCIGPVCIMFFANEEDFSRLSLKGRIHLLRTLKLVIRQLKKPAIFFNEIAWTCQLVLRMQPCYDLLDVFISKDSMAIIPPSHVLREFAVVFCKYFAAVKLCNRSQGTEDV